jgi:hypothetical protein
MKIISLDLQNDADIIKEELTNSKDEWFWPVDKKHKIFEQARMKFINRNLNYFNFPSMVAQTMEGNDFNPELPKTLDFCNKVRTLTGNNGPFGRMCLWELGPGCKLLRHKDDFRYHLYITRNIFIISDNKDANRQIVINNNKVPCEKGTLFQFSPAYDWHEFINESDNNFYFLGFDFWIENYINQFQKTVDFDAVVKNTARLAGFGGPGTEYKYISKH